MSEYVAPVRADLAELRQRCFYLLGTGAAVPTIVSGGLGVTFTRTSAGLYNFVWKENPGRFCGFTYGLGATTPSGLAGFNVVVGAYNASTFTITATVQTSAGTATDLASTQNLLLVFMFKESGV